MADQAVKAQESTRGPADGEAAPPRHRRFLTVGVFSGVMVVEGLAIVLVMKYFGAEPNPAEGLEMALTTRAASERAEIELASISVPNITETRTMYYKMRLVIVVDRAAESEVREALTRNKWTVEDAVVRLVREARERDLAEPDLQTMRRKIRRVVGELLGDEELIQQVLIPECMPLSTGF